MLIVVEKALPVDVKLASLVVADLTSVEANWQWSIWLHW